METAPARLIPITDHDARVLVPGDEFEPLPGSIVLTQGAWGTAHQKFFSDGLWYAVGRASIPGRTWEDMLTERNLVLVYDAPERESKVPEPVRYAHIHDASDVCHLSCPGRLR